MIDSFEIQVPSVVETEGDFVVTITALDINGDPVLDDNTTVVQIIPSDPNIVFDGDENGTYGEPGDDTKTLTNGQATFLARDTKAGRFTITATDTQLSTGQAEFLFSFNCLVIPSANTTPPQGTPFTGAYQFFQDRDSLEPYDEDPDNYELRALQAESFSDLGNLPVVYTENFVFEANDQGQGDATPIVTFVNNDGGSIVPTQGTALNQASYETNEIEGSAVATFDGDDFYDFENESDPLIKANSDFTIIVGARLLQSGGVQTVFSQYLNAANNGALVVRHDGGWELSIASDGTEPALSVKSGPGSVGTPAFIVFQREGNEFRVEVNGTLADSATDSGTRNVLETGNLLGARGNDALDYTASPTDFYPSDLLWFKIYGTALSEERKTLEYYRFLDQYTVPAAASTAYISDLETTYDFDLLLAHDEGIGETIVRDFSDNGFNGKILGTPNRGISGLNTDGGSAFEYDPGDHLVIPGFQATASTSHTFHFWVSTSEALGTEDRYLFDHQTNRLGLLWEVYNGGAGAGNIGFFDTAYKEFATALPRDGSTNLITYVFSGASCELYLNGVSQGTLAYSARTLPLSATTLRAYFDGSQTSGKITIDAVAYKNAAQIAGDVLAIYNAGIV